MEPTTTQLYGQLNLVHLLRNRGEMAEHQKELGKLMCMRNEKRSWKTQQETQLYDEIDKCL